MWRSWYLKSGSSLEDEHVQELTLSLLWLCKWLVNFLYWKLGYRWTVFRHWDELELFAEHTNGHFSPCLAVGLSYHGLCAMLHYTTLHSTPLHHTTPRHATPHHTTPHHTTLHYTTLHYTTPGKVRHLPVCFLRDASNNSHWVKQSSIKTVFDFLEACVWQFLNV